MHGHIQLWIQHTSKSAAAELGLTLAELVEINGCICDQLEQFTPMEGFNRQYCEDQELTNRQHLIQPTRSSNNTGYLLWLLCWWPRTATSPTQIQAIQDPQTPQIQSWIRTCLNLLCPSQSLLEVLWCCHKIPVLSWTCLISSKCQQQSQVSLQSWLKQAFPKPGKFQAQWTLHPDPPSTSKLPR
jgi:hypothetical protein